MHTVKYFVVLFFIFQLSSCQTPTQTSSVTKEIKFLALGDSYTIGQSVMESDRWPVQLAAKLNGEGIACEPPRIIAQTGWRTDQLKQAIANAAIQSNEYNLISLLIGVNNQYQNRSTGEYATEFEELLNMAIALADGKKENVFVVSIPDYGYTPFGQANQLFISGEIDQFNLINRSIAQQAGVAYFYITDISRRGLAEPSLVASDGLHPSGAMYAEWVELIYHGLQLK